MAAIILLILGGILAALAVNEESPETLDKFIDEWKKEGR